MVPRKGAKKTTSKSKKDLCIGSKTVSTLKRKLKKNHPQSCSKRRLLFGKRSRSLNRSWKNSSNIIKLYDQNSPESTQQVRKLRRRASDTSSHILS